MVLDYSSLAAVASAVHGLIINCPCMGRELSPSTNICALSSAFITMMQCVFSRLSRGSSGALVLQVDYSAPLIASISGGVKKNFGYMLCLHHIEVLAKERINGACINTDMWPE